MAPARSFFHQEVVDRFHDLLKAWVRPRRLGKTAAAPIDMILTSRRATQPDLLFVSNERLHIVEDRVRGAADLVAEVLSPDSHRRDRIEKRDLYEQHGVCANTGSLIPKPRPSRCCSSNVANIASRAAGVLASRRAHNC